MFPDQQTPNPGANSTPPRPPYQPPQNGVNSVPQQAANGQYEVVPPLPVNVTAGHSGHNPYEFIVNPPVVNRKSSLFGGDAFIKRIVAIVGLAVIVIVVLAIGVSLLGPKGSTTGLIAIAERQQEITRIATAATHTTTGQDATNFVANVAVSVGSSQSQTISYLTAHGTKLKPKQLALDQDAQTDTLLASAQATNTYDSAVVQNLTEQLTTYNTLLKTTYDQASSKAVKQLLQTSADTSSLLLVQAKAIQRGS